MNQGIPVIDVFAGCGGLSEGFVRNSSRFPFDISLALDANAAATATHRLRAFFNLFEDKAPDSYYRFLRGEISIDELYAAHPVQAFEAEKRIRLWELGSDAYPDAEMHQIIDNAISGATEWVLIGGPPCQAYSVAGRSRRSGSGYDANADNRNFLYREYLKILARHRPSVFVMENVPGMLNAKIDGRHVWQLMIEDLIDPSVALPAGEKSDSGDRRFDGYRVYSMVADDRGLDMFGVPVIDREEFIVKCENYGVPQRRHRVLLFGVRADIEAAPACLKPHARHIPAKDVLIDLPRLRSGLSKSDDTADNWMNAVAATGKASWLKRFDDPYGVVPEIQRAVRDLRRPRNGRGGLFVRSANSKAPRYRADWYSDSRIGGVCNHEARSHMDTDLQRYLFAACYAKATDSDLRLEHFPNDLLPEHRNVDKSAGGVNSHFADRFAVQRLNEPSRTVVSHIAKDGHYYIHPDPSQCRSLTVREAARLQTFPDNFYFMGNRTEQYQQVGNAVPPMLASLVADVVADLLEREGRLH